MHAILIRSSAGPISLVSLGFAALLAGTTTSAVQAATKFTSHQLTELNACLDQQNRKITTGPDHCAMFVAPARRHGRLTLTSGELDRMSECSDELSGDGTEGAGDNCAEFARWARAHH